MLSMDEEYLNDESGHECRNREAYHAMCQSAAYTNSVLYQIEH
jgi:hypothetical protein